MNYKNKQTFTVLCYAMNDSGRDIELMLPVRYFAETYLNCRFIHKTAYDIFAVYRYQPDIVFVPNTIGNHLYSEIAHYAHQQNIKVFALSSEGNFRTDGTFDHWGTDKVRKFVQEYVCMWNQRTIDYLKEKEPQYADKIVLTGGTGFDRYKIYRFLSKEEFLRKKKKETFSKIIGYASWGAFGKLHHAEGVDVIEYLFHNDKKKLEWLEQQRQFVESVLRQAIENNPDVLFILKRHPLETYEHIQNREVLNDIINLQHYENVVYIREEENIHDLINISDLWLGYESTTVLEAWLLEKTTIFINEVLDLNFDRSQNYKGCTIAANYPQLQQYIDEFYQNGAIPDFNQEEKQQERQRTMAEVFGFSDGLNHVRAGFYFKKTVEKAVKDQPLRKRKFSFKYFAMFMAMYIGKYFYNKSLFKKNKKLSKTIWIFENHKPANVAKLYEKYYPFLKEFHRQHQVPQLVEKGDIKAVLLDSPAKPVEKTTRSAD